MCVSVSNGAESQGQVVMKKRRSYSWLGQMRGQAEVGHAFSTLLEIIGHSRVCVPVCPCVCGCGQKEEKTQRERRIGELCVSIYCWLCCLGESHGSFTGWHSASLFLYITKSQNACGNNTGLLGLQPIQLIHSGFWLGVMWCIIMTQCSLDWSWFCFCCWLTDPNLNFFVNF